MTLSLNYTLIIANFPSGRVVLLSLAIRCRVSIARSALPEAKWNRALSGSHAQKIEKINRGKAENPNNQRHPSVGITTIASRTFTIANKC